MNNKTYQTPLAEIVTFSTEDIMSLSLNATNEGIAEDSININDLLI